MRRGGVNGLWAAGLAVSGVLAACPAHAALTDDLCLPSGDPQLAAYPDAAQLQQAA